MMAFKDGSRFSPVNLSYVLGLSVYAVDPILVLTGNRLWATKFLTTFIFKVLLLNLTVLSQMDSKVRKRTFLM